MQQAILDLIDKHIYWLSVVNKEWEPQEEYHSEWQLSLMKLRKDVVALWDGWIPVTERKPPHLKESKFWTDYGEVIWKRVIEYKNWWVDSEHYIDKNWKYFTPSHWQPLPLPPKQ